MIYEPWKLVANLFETPTYRFGQMNDVPEIFLKINLSSDQWLYEYFHNDLFDAIKYIMEFIWFHVYKTYKWYLQYCHAGIWFHNLPLMHHTQPLHQHSETNVYISHKKMNTSQCIILFKVWLNRFWMRTKSDIVFTCITGVNTDQCQFT